MDVNYFGQLLIDLQEHLKTAVPELKWIDQDLGQLENFEYPPLAYPACLMDFDATSYSELVGLAQIGEPFIVLRLAFNPFGQTYAAAPLDVREQALEYYKIEQKVFEAVQGFETEYTQPLIRMGADTEKRNDSLRVRILTFSTLYEDYSALPMNEKIAAGLEIQTEQIPNQPIETKNPYYKGPDLPE